MIRNLVKFSQNLGNAFTNMPNDIKYTFAASLKDYRGIADKKSVSLYTKTILLATSILNTPKYTIMRVLNIQNPINAFIFNIIYNMVNPFAAIVSALNSITPKAIKGIISATFSTVGKCLFGPFKYLFNQIFKGVQASSRAILKFFHSYDNARKLLMETASPIIEASIIDYFKKGILTLLNPIITVLKKSIMTIYKMIEKLFLTVFAPIVKCVKSVIYGIFGQYANILKGFVYIGTSMTGVLSVIGATGLASMTASLTAPIAAAITPVSMLGMTMLSGFSVMFLNSKILATIAQKTVNISNKVEKVQMFIQVKDTIYGLYNLKNQIDDAFKDLT